MSANPDRQPRLLIVDDSRVIRVSARKILQNHFETVEATDGQNALEILETQEPFTLVVTDLTMPNMDGFELLHKVRDSHQPHIRELPVIIITGANDSESTMHRATAAGATDFIGKPFDAVHLLARTQSHASAYSNRQSLSMQNLGLEEQAMLDPTTGLANEKAFMERGYQLLSYSVRHHSGFAVAQLEIDDYDIIYRQHGEGMAEAAIRHVADVLHSSIRGEDLIARTGPARFSLLLTEMEARGVRQLTSRISEDIRNRTMSSGSDVIRFTASIGIAAPEITPTTRFDSLLQTACDNLLVAIKAGGNRVETGADAGAPAWQPPHGIPGLDIPDSNATDLHTAADRDADLQYPADSYQEEEEIIVITAPYDMFEEETKDLAASGQPEPGTTSGNTSQAAGTAHGADPAPHTQAAPADGSAVEVSLTLEESTITVAVESRKRGFIARLFGVFSRRN